MKEEKNRPSIKFILSKVFLLLICIIFISTYKTIFGNENSLVGVMLLTGLLIFMGSDFGYDAKYAAIAIPITFVGVGVFSKLSNNNAYIGIVINFMVIQSIFIISKGDKSNNVYLPFMMGYLMFKGYDVSGISFSKRIISLALIGSIIGLVYFLINKKKVYNKPYKDMIQSFPDKKSYKRWKLVLTVTLVIAIFFGDLFSIEKSMWINLAIFSLIPPDKEHAGERKIKRIPGTILGSVICILIFGYLVPMEYYSIVMLIGGFTSMFMTKYLTKTIFNSFSALATASMIMPLHEAATLRIVSNIIALVFAILSVFAFEQIFKKIDEKYNDESKDMKLQSLSV